jgi:hypothetical protein
VSPKTRRAFVASLVAVAACSLVFPACAPDASTEVAPAAVAASTARELDESQLLAAVRGRFRDRWIESSARVVALLADDLEGDRHQRFLLKLEDGSTVLVAHNLDLAPHVPVEKGDTVELRGEYVWNEKGGVVHWTHHDPRRPGGGGWIRVRGKTYR